MTKVELMATLDEVLIKFDKYREEAEELIQMYSEDLKATTLRNNELEKENDELKKTITHQAVKYGDLKRAFDDANEFIIQGDEYAQKLEAQNEILRGTLRQACEKLLDAGEFCFYREQ